MPTDMTPINLQSCIPHICKWGCHVPFPQKLPTPLESTYLPWNLICNGVDYICKHTHGWFETHHPPRLSSSRNKSLFSHCFIHKAELQNRTSSIGTRNYLYCPMSQWLSQRLVLSKYSGTGSAKHILNEYPALQRQAVVRIGTVLCVVGKLVASLKMNCWRLGYVDLIRGGEPNRVALLLLAQWL